MKKESFASKLAKKMLGNKKINEGYEQSWGVHEGAFGPILTPAFVNDQATRVNLVAALNAISRGDVVKGLKKLDAIHKNCETDADKAAWLFCQGLAFEMGGDKDHMIEFYQAAGEYHHNFFLPYLKVAKSAHEDAVFEVAEKNYKEAILCLETHGSGSTITKEQALASAYSNLASCLTMMHQYEEAQEMLEKSKEVLQVMPGREGTAAVLYAAMEQAEEAKEQLEALEATAAMLYEPTKKVVLDILEEKHAHFCVLPSKSDKMTSFWQWFVENEAELDKMLKNEAVSVIETLIEKLQPMFPFMERELELGIMMGDDCHEVYLADFFAKSMHAGYEELLSFCPEEVKKRWIFIIVH